MYKLIESNGNGIKEVLNNGKVVWRKEDRKSVLIRSERLSVEKSGDDLFINRLKTDWDYIEIDDIRIDKSDGEFKVLFLTVFKITNKQKRHQLENKFIGSYQMFNVKQYKYI